MYIEPQYQIPQYAESCMPDYKRALDDFVAGITTFFETLGEALCKAMQPIVRIFERFAERLYDSGVLKHPRRKHYRVPYRVHPISTKHAMIYKRKQERTIDALEKDIMAAFKMYKDKQVKGIL